MVELTFIQIAFAVGWTYLQAALYKKAFPPLHMLLIHGSRPIENILYKFGTRKDKYSIDKCIDIAEGDETVKKESNEWLQCESYFGTYLLLQRNKLYKFIYSRGTQDIYDAQDQQMCSCRDRTSFICLIRRYL
jgi:hypothetical protein